MLQRTVTNSQEIHLKVLAEKFKKRTKGKLYTAGMQAEVKYLDILIFDWKQ